MRQIFETYKDIILSGLTAALLLALLVGGNFLQLAGEGIAGLEENRDYETYTDSLAMQKICRREPPIITCQTARTWKAGVPIRIMDVFQSRDAEGNGAALKVMEITDAGGNDRMESYEKESGMVQFPEAGIYHFRLRAMDNEKKTTTERIALVVDN